MFNSALCVNPVAPFMCRPSASETSKEWPEIKENKKRPFLITLSARALSSVGFGLSLIAISIEWFFGTTIRSGDHEQNQTSDGGRRRPSLRPQHRLSLPPNYGSTPSSQHTSRKHVKRVSFASVTVQSYPPLVSISMVHDVVNLTSASSNPIGATSLHPKMIEKNEVALPTPLLCQTENAAPPASPVHHGSTEMESRSLKAILGPLGRQSQGRGVKFFPNDSRSSSPIERISRRITSLKFTPKKSSTPTPKRRHTVPSCCPLQKSRDRRPARTLPYEAPYFATPPAPIHARHSVKSEEPEDKHMSFTRSSH